jgi:ribonuclease H / adenosylcobalamin/alpha-ribazole phosphatase
LGTDDSLIEGAHVTGYPDPAASVVTRLIFVRHGQTDAATEGRLSSRSADISINALGRQQVEHAARRLCDFGPAALYASPLRRTRETAAIIAESLGLEPVYRDELLEFDFGNWSELTYREASETFPELYGEMARWMTAQIPERPQVPGAEPVSEFMARLARFRDLALSEHPGETVVAVTHGAAIKGFMGLLSGDDLTGHGRFFADPGSVSVVDICDGVPTIRLFNEAYRPNGQLSFGRPKML